MDFQRFAPYSARNRPTVTPSLSSTAAFLAFSWEKPLFAPAVRSLPGRPAAQDPNRLVTELKQAPLRAACVPSSPQTCTRRNVTRGVEVLRGSPPLRRRAAPRIGRARPAVRIPINLRSICHESRNEFSFSRFSHDSSPDSFNITQPSTGTKRYVLASRVTWGRYGAKPRKPHVGNCPNLTLTAPGGAWGTLGVLGGRKLLLRTI